MMKTNFQGDGNTFLSIENIPIVEVLLKMNEDET